MTSTLKKGLRGLRGLSGVRGPFNILGLSRRTKKQSEMQITNLLDIIQQDTFEDPIKTALFIEFTVKNEMAIAFGTKFEKIDEVFIHYLDKDISDKKLEKIKIEDINYYYAYLYQRFHEIVELYATYDYLLCFAYHLKRAAKHNFVPLASSSRGSIKKNRKTRLLDKINNKGVLISNSVPLIPQMSNRNTRNKNKTLGGTKKYLYKQSDFLSFINRSFWGKMGSSIMVGGGAVLSTVGCSLFAPFIYDSCIQVLETPICNNYSLIGSSTIDTLASSGMLSTSITNGMTAGIASIGLLSIMQRITNTEESEFVFPKAQATEGIFNRDPVKINAINIPDRANVMEPNLEMDQLLSELAKFNGIIIHEKFIGSKQVIKFRKLMRDFILEKLKTIFDEKLEETVMILKRKLFARKTEISLTTRDENPDITSKSMAQKLEDNKENLRINDEEMAQIETQARSKVSGFILDQANYRLRDEIAKGIAGFEKIKEETIAIRPVNQELFLEAHANSIRDNLFTILASFAHIESENGFFLDQKTIDSVIYFYYFYLIGLYLYQTLEKANKTRGDYGQIVVMFVLFLYLLLLTSQNFGFDPINIEEIRRNNTIVDTEKEKIFKSKLEAFKNAQYNMQTATTTNTTSIPTTSANIANVTKLRYVDTFFEKGAYLESAIKTEELLNDPNLSTSVPFIEKQITDDYTKCYVDAKNAYVGADMAKRWCELSKIGSKVTNNVFWVRLLMHQMISKVALSDIMLQLADGKTGSNIKIAFLSTYAGLNFACTKYKTVGSLGCLAMSFRSVIKNYGDFKRRKQQRIFDIGTTLTPFEFKMNDLLKIVDDDVNEGGGLRMREGIQTMNTSLEQIVKFNHELQTTLNTLNVDIGTKVQIGTFGLGERRLEIEEKRANREDMTAEEKEKEKNMIDALGFGNLPNGEEVACISELNERLRKLYVDESLKESNFMSICGGGGGAGGSVGDSRKKKAIEV